MSGSGPPRIWEEKNSIKTFLQLGDKGCWWQPDCTPIPGLRCLGHQREEGWLPPPHCHTVKKWFKILQNILLSSDTTTADNHSDNSTCQDIVGAGNPRASQSKVKLAPTCPRVSVGGVIMIGACNIIVSTIWQSLAIVGNWRHSHLFAGPPVVHGQLWQLGGKFSANTFLSERTRRPVSQTVAPADLANSV